MATKGAMRIYTEEICQMYPDACANTIAKHLQHKFNVTENQARVMVRKVYGVFGEYHRRNANVPLNPRKKRESGWKPKVLESKAEERPPFHLPLDAKIGIFADTHFPFHDEQAYGVALTELHHHGIDVLFINGDLVDFYSISKFSKDPRFRDPLSEVEDVRQAIKDLREMFPDIPIVYKAANHEERWNDYLSGKVKQLASDPLLSLSRWLGLEELDIELVDRKRMVMAGKLPILHGHEFARGLTNPVNPARGAFLKVQGSCMVAHQHRSSTHTQNYLDEGKRKVATTWSLGCLCTLTPEYATINAWNHGFAVIEVDDAGRYDVENYQILQNGEVWRA